MDRPRVRVADAQLAELLMVVSDDPRRDWSQTALANAVGLSTRQIGRRLYRMTGMTPAAFVEFVRVRRAVELLAQRSQTLAEIAGLVGFKSGETMRRAFLRQTGRPPGWHRRHQADC